MKINCRCLNPVCNVYVSSIIYSIRSVCVWVCSNVYITQDTAFHWPQGTKIHSNNTKTGSFAFVRRIILYIIYMCSLMYYSIIPFWYRHVCTCVTQLPRSIMYIYVPGRVCVHFDVFYLAHGALATGTYITRVLCVYK